jgi:hypothetical protein
MIARQNFVFVRRQHLGAFKDFIKRAQPLVIFEKLKALSYTQGIGEHHIKLIVKNLRPAKDSD